MDTSVLLGGFGGQGVQTIGKLLTYGANEAGQYVTFYPAYGGEMRGGTSNCTVIAGDEEIASPSRHSVDYVIALNIPSFKAFEKRVASGGTLILNTSIIKEKATRDDISVVGIPANEIAEACGSLKVLNVVLLGFFAEFSGIMDREVLRKVVMDKLGSKAQYIEMNKKAFDEGVKYAQGLNKNYSLNRQE